MATKKTEPYKIPTGKVIATIATIIGLIVTIIQGAKFIGTLEEKIDNLEQKTQSLSKTIEIQNRLSSVEADLKKLKKCCSDIPTKENCNTISPIFIEPIPKITKLSATLKIKVSKRPIEHTLWLLVFNENMKMHTDLQQILPGDDMEWERNVSLKGGAIKDKYIVEIILATKDEHKKFLECYKKRSMHLCEMPEGYICCRDVVLSIN
ncbi:hypothetical protein [Desulfobacter postgatei]|uniref:hypothetical protein n=1 Tax=Desulfobacter TaxID=2289 RepID=UPI002A36742D|nr:hypothetical protein [Desulfobacter postgatei]MDX9964787.1 hypothetical protein [Desulfobacter postgatei]